jgi:hypothetical protein
LRQIPILYQLPMQCEMEPFLNYSIISETWYVTYDHNLDDDVHPNLRRTPSKIHVYTRDLVGYG